MSPLREAMRKRLSRYIEGMQEAPEEMVWLLQEKASDSPTDSNNIADKIEEVFENQVFQITSRCVNPLLIGSVLDQPTFLADMWPLDEAFSHQIFLPDSGHLFGLKSNLLGTMPVPGTTSALRNWPMHENPIDVFRWMETAGSASQTDTLYVLSQCCLMVCNEQYARNIGFEEDHIKSFFSRIPNKDHATSEKDLYDFSFFDFIHKKFSSLAPNACAVVYFVERHCKELLKESSTASFYFAIRMLALLTRDQPDANEIRTQIATDALREKAPELVTNQYAISQLEKELRFQIEKLRSKLELEEPHLTTQKQTIAEEDGIFLYDSRFASYVELLGNAGKDLAGQVRKSAEKRMDAYKNGASAGSLWTLWADPNTAPIGCRFARSLAQVLWIDVVRVRVRKPIALTMAVHEPVTGLFSRIQIEEEHNGQRKIILPDQTLMRLQDTASVGADTINALMVGRGLKLFGSITSHRVLRFQIFKAHEQALCNNPDPRVIRIDGGYSALAHDLLGMKGNKAINEVRDIIEAEHACEIPLPPESTFSRLLIRTFLPARGARQAHLMLVLGTALLPDYVYELQKAFGKSRDLRRAQKLVPVLDLPPFVGKRSNEHGPQATLSMILISFMRDNARQFIEEGGVRIDTDTFIALAQKAGLPISMVNAVRDRWKQDGDDGPALLKEVEKDRYTLGKTHILAQTFLEEGARKELEGEAAGKRGVHNRRAKIKRLSQLKKG